MGQDNLVGAVVRLRFAQQNHHGLIQFPARTKDFSLLYDVQAGPVAKPASYIISGK
jgi:hypothetical protein